MKSLRESLLDDDLIDKTDKMIKDEIKAFLKENFIGASSCKISRKPNIDGKYEVWSSANIGVKNKNITSLTNWAFIWTTVNGYFCCNLNNSLKSLEGAPKEVGGYFDCSVCKSLESLKGAPKVVGGSFGCSGCNSLKSLEGAPEKVEGNFSCISCQSLKTLKGAPQTVNGDFRCYNCDSLISLDGAPIEIGGDFYCAFNISLKSLEGAPKIVGGDFNCMSCSGQFTKKDVKKISNVKGKIIC